METLFTYLGHKINALRLEERDKEADSMTTFAAKLTSIVQTQDSIEEVVRDSEIFYLKLSRAIAYRLLRYCDTIYIIMTNRTVTCVDVLFCSPHFLCYHRMPKRWG